jgi:hypothetical protein
LNTALTLSSSRGSWIYLVLAAMASAIVIGIGRAC